MERIQNKSVSKYTYHTITLDDTGYSGLQPLSFHDNTVGAQEKMQRSELEASIQAMKWEAGDMAAVSERNSTGSPEWQERDTGGPSQGTIPP